MARVTRFIPWFLVAGFALGCPSKPPETAFAQRDRVRTESREALQAARDYAYAERAEFVGEMKKDLAEIQGEMDRLRARIERSSGEAQADARARLDAVRAKWDQAKAQLDRAEGATESTWDDVKGGFRKVHGDLKESFLQTRQWLGDKIAP